MEKLFRKISHLINGPEICIFHEFHKPPYGGGNQFLMALEGELKRQGFDVGRNNVGPRTRVVLFNSFNFDFEKLSKLRGKYKALFVHRVDGPIGTYRGEEVDVDKKIWEMNHELADKSIFQSKYSLDKHIELGLEFKNPTIITNASDPSIFNKDGKVPSPKDRKIRLIATSWSDNPKKGGPTLAWLDGHFDRSKYELTFVGRTKAEFKNARVIAPVASEELARLLKEHDIYIAPSEDDPCSNALIEALSCGLPAVFRLSGGHPELVGSGGEGFTTGEELLLVIDKVADNYDYYQSRIKAESLEEVARKYLDVFNS